MEQNLQISSPITRVLNWIDSTQILSRPYDLATIALLTISLALYLWRFDSFQVGSYMDDARYITLAQSIVEGDGYGIVDSSDKLIQAAYPIGFPLVLAPVYALVGSNFVVLKMVSLLFTLASILLIVKWWKPLGLPSATIALAIAALTALSPVFVKHAGMVMSEAAFGFFVLLGLILTVRSERTRFVRLQYLALGIVWMLAGSVRTIGITLIGASALYLILHRRWRDLALTIVGLASALILVILFTDIAWRDLNSVEEYMRQFSGIAVESQRIPPGILASWLLIGISDYMFVYLRDGLVPLIGGPKAAGLLSGFGLGFLPWVISGLVLISVAVGYIVNIRKNGWLPVHFYIPMSAGILILWLGRGERFLYGLLPFLFAFMLIGGQSLIQAVVAGVRKYAPQTRFANARVMFALQAGAIGLLLILQFVGSVRIQDSLNHVPDFRIGNTWIKDNTPRDAVVLAEQPEISFLYSRRMAEKLPSNPIELKDGSAREKSTYLLIAPAVFWYADKTSFKFSRDTLRVLDALRANELPAELVYEDQSAMVQVYRILPTTKTTTYD